MEKTGSKLTDLTDLELVELAISGNQLAYVMLYNRYYAGVKSHIANLQ